MRAFLVIFLAICAVGNGSKVTEKRHTGLYHSGFTGSYGSSFSSSGWSPSELLAPPPEPISPIKHVSFNSYNNHLPSINTYIEPTKIITKIIKYPVPVPHPVPVEVKHPVPVPHPVPVEVKRPYPVPVPHPVPVYISKPYPVNVNRPVPVYIKQYVPVPVHVEQFGDSSGIRGDYSSGHSNSVGFQGHQEHSSSYAQAFAHSEHHLSSGSSGYSYEAPAKAW